MFGRAVFTLAALFAAGAADAQDFLDSGVEVRVPSLEEREAYMALATHHSAFNAFLNFKRDPSEDASGTLVAMDDFGSGPQAYFRDFFVAAETFADAPDDGDVWTAELHQPDGTVIQFDHIEFHSTLQGNSNCFLNVERNAAVCNATSIVITWFTPARCRSTPNWQWFFLYNGAAFDSPSHKVLPQVPVGSMVSYNQGDFSDPYDHLCVEGIFDESGEPCPDPIPIGLQEGRIFQFGCYLSAVSDVLTYFDVPVTPASANTTGREFLDPVARVQRGYTANGLLKYEFPSQLAADAGKFITRVDGPNGPIDLSDAGQRAAFQSLICAGGPQVIQASARHYMAALGTTEDGTKFIVNNPDGGGIEEELTGPALSGRFFSGPQVDLTLVISGVVITAWSPVELLLTDPAGRRLGIDPSTSSSLIDEISLATYEDAGLRNNLNPVDGPTQKMLELSNPVDGDYTLQVTGTASGTYRLDFEVTRADETGTGATFLNVATSPGTVHKYAFNFNKAAGAPFSIAGGFNGGGQRPADVNRFLTYTAPTATRSTLPPGTTSTTVGVAYASSIIPASFIATLDGVDITASFNPSPGSVESITIPLSAGSNTLALRVDGTLANGRVATDTDRLVFLVP